MLPAVAGPASDGCFAPPSRSARPQKSLPFIQLRRRAPATSRDGSAKHPSLAGPASLVRGVLHLHRGVAVRRLFRGAPTRNTTPQFIVPSVVAARAQFMSLFT